MVMKRVMVGCLITAILIGASGAVMASPLDTGTADMNATDINAVGTDASMGEDEDVAVTPEISYTTHVQDVGWQTPVKNGKMAGTKGRSLRLEGIKIEVAQDQGIGIEYATHVQNIGWQDFVANGKMAGTEGMTYRLEAIKIRLTGENADKYDVVYRVHAQNVGWMGYAMNGESAGTAGYSYRLEGIEIQIVEKGSFAGDTTNAFKDIKDDRTTVAYADAKYGNIINEYSQFVQNGAVNAANYKHVNINTNLKRYLYEEKDPTLDYTYKDINSDNVDELIIAVSHTIHPQRGGYPFVDELHQVYDMYTINDDGEPVRIIDEPDANIQKWYTLYQNNIVMTFNRTTSYCAETYLKDNRLVEKRVGYWKDVNSLSNWMKEDGLKRDSNITWKPVTGGVGQFKK